MLALIIILNVSINNDMLYESTNERRENMNLKKKLMLTLALGMSCSQMHLAFAQSAPPLVPIQQDTGNLLQDSSFENHHNHWLKTGDAQFSSYGNSAASGNWYCLLPQGSRNACAYQKVTLKPNTNYIAKAKVLVGKQGGLAYFNVKTQDVSTLINGAEVSVSYKKEYDWKYQDVELKFNTKNYTNVAICIMKWTDKDQNIINSQIQADDIQLFEEGNNQQQNQTYKTLWYDNFDQKSLNLKDWEYELGSIRGHEQQHYVNNKENVFIRNGKLVLRATDRDKKDQYQNPRNPSRTVIYNSGSVRTHGHKEFLYGRIEIRAKLPKGQGVFPAFWTLGHDFTLDGNINGKQGYGWPRCGEIDIMELTGKAGNHPDNKRVWQTLHTGTANSENDHKLGGTSHTINEDFNNGYHTFGINWNKDSIEWYVDNKIVARVDYSHDKIAKTALNRPHYIQLNLAMGGSWPGEVGKNLAGTEFEIDHVVYARNQQQEKDAQEYYAKAPKLEGVKPLTIEEGDTDVLKGLTTSNNYHIDYSIEDSPQFKAEGGLTKVNLLCKGKDDLSSLKALKPGQYTIHYTAIPNDIKYTHQGLSAEKDYLLARKSTTLTIVKKKKVFKMLENPKSVTQGEEAVFKSEAPFDTFKEVMVDNKVIDKKFYTVKSGSTVVTLSKDYTSTLSAENHTLSIVSEEGSATALFNVTKKAVSPDNNKDLSKPDNKKMPKTKNPSKPSVKETPKPKTPSKPDGKKEMPKEKGKVSPKTSDTTSIMGFVLISLISLFILYFSKKQKA